MQKAARRVHGVLSRFPPSLWGALVILIPALFIAILPGLVAPYQPNAIISPPLLGPTAAHLLGTDEIGRDIFSRVIWSARSSVTVSLASTGLAFVSGTLAGVAIGYRGGAADAVGMRVVDVLLSFPTMILALFMIAVFGNSQLVEILAIALVMTPSMARFARSGSILLRNRAYVEASLILRARPWHVIRHHLLPNIVRSLLVAASVLGASAVLIAAGLAYLGLGTQPPTPSWGYMLYTALKYVFTRPIYGIVPGVCITLLAYGYTLLGRGLGELRVKPGRQLIAAVHV